MNKAIKILHLEDEPNASELVQNMLEADGYMCDFKLVDNKEDFVKEISDKSYDLIFSDYSLPKFDGKSALDLVKEKQLDIPFIFISGRMGEEIAIESLKQGATDYVLKSKITRLIPCVERALEEHNLIVQRRQLISKLNNMAYYDKITGLPNRFLFEERLKQSIKQNKRDKNCLFAVLFMDLDNFKKINDSFGHKVGDELLKAVANKLLNSVREVDTVARFGGDEFAILINGVDDTHDAVVFAERIIRALQKPLKVADRELFTSISIGITLSTQESNTIDSIIRDADIAMYMAKYNGGSCYQFYNPKIQQEILQNLELETDLRGAITHKQLELFYQPIFLIETGEIKGFESLLRWHHPIHGDIEPSKFIPLAEKSNIILSMGEWVLYNSAQQIKEWNDKFKLQSPLFISINVSARQLMQDEFFEKLDKVITKLQIDPALIKLEITETAALKLYKSMNKLVSELKDRGVEISLDDFGTGYSSLTHLANLQVDNIKIDREFIKHLENQHSNGNKIVLATTALANSMAIPVIAEGIETKQQLNMLKNINCKYGQGFLISKPVRKETAEQIIRDQVNLNNL